MATVKLLALCVVFAVGSAACLNPGDATLTAGSGATTTTQPPLRVEPTTTTLLALPTTAPLPTATASPDPGATEVPPTTVAPTTTAAPTTTRPAVLAGPVVYRITGGIGGVNDRLTIGSDGTANFQGLLRSVSFTLSPDRLRELAAALNLADFPTLGPVYGVHVPDGFEYRVSYVGKEVLVFGSAAPARLKPALSILGQEMERGRTM